MTSEATHHTSLTRSTRYVCPKTSTVPPAERPLNAELPKAETATDSIFGEERSNEKENFVAANSTQTQANKTVDHEL